MMIELAKMIRFILLEVYGGIVVIVIGRFYGEAGVSAVFKYER